jgi:hypothetical protein
MSQEEVFRDTAVPISKITTRSLFQVTASVSAANSLSSQVLWLWLRQAARGVCIKMQMRQDPESMKSCDFYTGGFPEPDNYLDLENWEIWVFGSTRAPNRTECCRQSQEDTILQRENTWKGRAHILNPRLSFWEWWDRVDCSLDDLSQKWAEIIEEKKKRIPSV